MVHMAGSCPTNDLAAVAKRTFSLLIAFVQRCARLAQRKGHPVEGPQARNELETIGGRYDYKRLQKQHFLQQPRNVLSRSHQSQVNQTKRDNDLETYDSQPLGNPLIASRFL